MSSLKYTVLAGDTMTSIADGVNAATGVTYQQIEAANPNMPANALQVGAVIDIPAPAGGTAMRYTVMAGDTYSGIATDINDQAGVTVSDIESANPNVKPNSMQVGTVLTVTAGGHPDPAPIPTPDTPASNVGYWCWTWSPGQAPTGCTLGIAFRQLLFYPLD